MTTAHTTYRNALKIGTMLQEYRLDSVLGVGGFGMTYLATDTNLDKRVAIKEYFPSDLAVREPDGGVAAQNTHADDGYKWGLDRFIQEARVLAKFSHPHIVRVNRYFEANATGYMVMDYENGESLNQILKNEPPPSEARIRELIFPLLDGLQAVHETGFLHRDIKPANIFVRTNKSPVLLDFGAARQAVSGATKSLTAVLTPGYAPLEQYSGQGNQGPWSDIYAMAGVLYRAYTSENPPDAVSRLKNDTVPAKLAQLKGRVSEPALHAMQWALSLDEKQRPATVEIWKRALEGKAASPASVHVTAASVTDQNAPTRVVTGMAAGVAASAPPAAAAAAPARRTPMRLPYDVEEEPSSPWRWVIVGVVVLVAIFGGRAWYTGQRDAKLAKEEAGRAEAARLAVAQPQTDTRSVEERAAQIMAGNAADADKAAADRAEALRRLEEERGKGAAAAPAATAPAAPAVPAPVPPAPVPAEARKPTPSEAAPKPVPPPVISDPIENKLTLDFRYMDGNGDGYLTPDEVRGRPFIERNFPRLDADRDGRLSFSEYLGIRPFGPTPEEATGGSAGPGGPFSGPPGTIGGQFEGGKPPPPFGGGKGPPPSKR